MVSNPTKAKCSAWYSTVRSIAKPPPIGHVKVMARDDGTQVIDTGPAQFRILAGEHPSAAAADAGETGFPACGQGTGRPLARAHWSGGAPPTGVSVRPAWLARSARVLSASYTFANGAQRTVTLSFDAGQPVVQIDEQGSGPRRANSSFISSPSEGFSDYFGLIRSARWIEPLVRRSPPWAWP